MVDFLKIWKPTTTLKRGGDLHVQVIIISIFFHAVFMILFTQAAFDQV
jgi:hypothetical protein